MRVRCDDEKGCVAEADAVPVITGSPERDRFGFTTPSGWTDNDAIGLARKHYCPDHPQPETPPPIGPVVLLHQAYEGSDVCLYCGKPHGEWGAMEPCPARINEPK